jgi:exonuclease III
MRFGTRNVRSLYGTGSVKTVASKLAKHNADLVAVQEIRWDKCGSEPADDYTFFLWK